jgi:hypothetical protein
MRTPATLLAIATMTTFAPSHPSPRSVIEERARQIDPIAWSIYDANRSPRYYRKFVEPSVRRAWCDTGTMADWYCQGKAHP